MQNLVSAVQQEDHASVTRFSSEGDMFGFLLQFLFLRRVRFLLHFHTYKTRTRPSCLHLLYPLSHVSLSLLLRTSL